MLRLHWHTHVHTVVIAPLLRMRRVGRMSKIQVFLNESATYSPDNWLVCVDKYACMALQMNTTLLTLFSLWLYLFVNIGFYYSCSEKGPESSSPR